MSQRNHFYHSQLEAIRSFCEKLQNRVEEQISLRDAVVAWFANGHAEKFRQEYLSRRQIAVH